MKTHLTNLLRIAAFVTYVILLMSFFLVVALATISLAILAEWKQTRAAQVAKVAGSAIVVTGVCWMLADAVTKDDHTWTERSWLESQETE